MAEFVAFWRCAMDQMSSLPGAAFSEGQEGQQQGRYRVLSAGPGSFRKEDMEQNCPSVLRLSLIPSKPCPEQCSGWYRTEIQPHPQKSRLCSCGSKPKTIFLILTKRNVRYKSHRIRFTKLLRLKETFPCHLQAGSPRASTPAPGPDGF